MNPTQNLHSIFLVLLNLNFMNKKYNKQIILG